MGIGRAHCGGDGFHLLQRALREIEVVLGRGLDGVGVHGYLGHRLVDPVARLEDVGGQHFLAMNRIVGLLHQLVHAGRVGGDADAALPGMRDQAADPAEKARDVAGDASAGIGSRGADGVRQVGLAFGNGGDIAVELVE